MVPLAVIEALCSANVLTRGDIFSYHQVAVVHDKMPFICVCFAADCDAHVTGVIGGF